MAYKTENLQAGEEVVLDLHPHWWFFGPAAGSLVAAIVLGVLSLALDWESWLQVPIAVVILVTLLWFGLRYAQWASTDLVLTTNRLIYQSGIVSKTGIEIPLGRINTIFSTQGVFERLIGVGDLRVESASTEGAQVFENMKKPGKIRNEINVQMDANQMRYAGVRSPEPAEPDALAQIERLAALRDQGSITEAEFQAKKAQLLDRM